MKDLLDIRKEIDLVDDEIIKLFVKRMGLSKEVAEVKKNSNVLVTDTSREDKIIYRLTSALPDELKLYAKEVYSAIFSVSKAYQNTLVDKTSKTVEKIKEVIGKDYEFPITATVACQGVEGANSESAAKKAFPICDISYFKTFESVFNAVDKGLCEFGVLPIENSTAGSVLEVYDLMDKYNFYVVKSVKLKINHCLAGVVGATKKDIKKVISHSQAIMQCSNYLKNNNFESELAQNTALAGKIVQEGNDKSVAALCSKECACLYGLKILEENVQDNLSNYTRFIVISKDLKIYNGSNKISVITSAPHESGSLSKILQKFYSLGLSLTKIESRPIMGSDFEFLFYFDFEGDVKDKGVLNLLSELENSSMKFAFLGSFKEIIWNIV